MTRPNIERALAGKKIKMVWLIIAMLLTYTILIAGIVIADKDYLKAGLGTKDAER